MSINIIDNFSVNTSSPIDSRMVVADNAAKTAIVYKYIGLRIHQLDNGIFYYWNGSSWVDENNGLINSFGSGVTGSFPYWYSSGTISGSSSLYYSGNKIGVNTNDPKEYFQINSQYWPSPSIATPLTINKGGTTVIGFNWWYDTGSSTEMTFDSSRYSAKISYDDITTGKLIFSHKNPLDSTYLNSLSLDKSSTIVSPTYSFEVNTFVSRFISNNFYVSSTSSIGMTSISGTLSLYAQGGVSITTPNAVTPSNVYLILGTSSTSTSHGALYISNGSATCKMNSTLDNVGGYATFSINTGSSGYPTSIEIVSADALSVGTNVKIKSGSGLVSGGSGIGGKVLILAGSGSTNGAGGSVSVSAGNTDGAGAAGDVHIIGGMNTTDGSMGYIYHDSRSVTKSVYKNYRIISVTNPASFVVTEDDHFIFVNLTKTATPGSALLLPTPTKNRELYIMKSNNGFSGVTFSILGTLEVNGTDYVGTYPLGANDKLHLLYDTSSSMWRSFNRF